MATSDLILKSHVKRNELTTVKLTAYAAFTTVKYRVL